MVSRAPGQTSDPHLHEGVRALLAAASAPAEPGPLPGEEEALAAFLAQRPRKTVSMRSSFTTRRVAVASSIGAVALLAGGVGAAAAGVLPGAAQESVSDLLTTIGVDVPGADEQSAGHPDRRGPSEDGDGDGDGTDSMTESGASGTSGASGDEPGKGATVSGLAQDDGTQGLDKGAAVSGTASGGKSKAGQHAPPEDPGAQSSGQDAGRDAAVTAPNHGGPGAAGDATEENADGASSAGTDAADEASSGHSAEGSKNRP